MKLPGSLVSSPDVTRGEKRPGYLSGPADAPDAMNPAAGGVLTAAAAQPSSASRVFPFAFAGLEAFAGIALAVIRFFPNAEKDLPGKRAEIRAHAEAKKAGKAGENV